MSKHRLVCFVFLIACFSSWSEQMQTTEIQMSNNETQTTAPGNSVTVPEFVKLIQLSHPYLAARIEEGQQREFAVRSARSEFDPTITQETASRLGGYYDGNYAAGRFEQPLQEMNARVYSEYRVSEGDFPSYEGDMRTLSAGEASLGVMLSLLRNNEIDKRRLELRNTKIAVEQWQAEYTNDVNELIFKGVKDYLYWYETALQVKTIGDLLDALARRRVAIATRVEQGDLPESELIEFDANALQQQIVLAELERKLAVLQQSLAFYIRDENGVMADTSSLKVTKLEWPYAVNNQYIADLRRALLAHPQVNILQDEARMLANKQLLAKNQLLPKLDVKASVARDLGSGLSSLDGTETKVGLSFSYLLGNERARAELFSVESKQRQLQHKLQLASDAVRQAFEQAYQHWMQTRTIAEMNRDNADYADRLYSMEITRFDAGDTDMFVLNTREATQIRARMKQIKADVDVYLAELALHHAAAKLPLY